MTLYVILESLKIIAWVFVLVMVLKRRKQIPVNLFWLTAISAAFMVLGGLDDVLHYEFLSHKSEWWLIASFFMIANYITFIRGCCRFQKSTRRTLEEFVTKIEKDKTELNENTKP